MNNGSHINDKVKLNRILSGEIRCRLGDDVFRICPPTPSQLYELEELCEDVEYQAGLFGVMSNDEMYNFMLENNLWNLNKENQVESLPLIVDRLKIELWQSYVGFKGKQCDQLRSQIIKNNATLQELMNEKHKYDLYTISGLLSLFKVEYLINCNLYKNEHRININSDVNLLRKLTNYYFDNQLSDDDIRNLSKNYYWKSIWGTGKTSYELFGVSSIWLTKEQRSLIGWSKLYTNIYENIDCPPEHVIEDDMLLDGWLLLQNKIKNEERENKIGNKHKDNLPHSSEVFIPVETKEDAARVNKLNSPHAMAVKKQRMKMLEKYGKVREENMPDSQIAMQRQAIQQYKSAVKG